MKKRKVVYEPEDDVLNIWLSNEPFAYAEDEDGVIIHYTKDHEPVYIEILDASKFLNLQKIKSQKFYPAVAHEVKLKRK